MATGPALRVASVYRHTQATPSTTWTIVHNLNTYPIVDAYVADGANVVKILPKTVVYTNGKTVTLTFTEARSGFATVV